MERHPPGAGREGRDRQKMPVLVPRPRHTVAALLAEDLTAPEDDVGTDQLLYQIEDAGLAREGKEVAAAAHALAVAALDMRADQTLGPHRRVLGDQAIERYPQIIDPGARQA